MGELRAVFLTPKFMYFLPPHTAMATPPPSPLTKHWKESSSILGIKGSVGNTLRILRKCRIPGPWKWPQEARKGGRYHKTREDTWRYYMGLLPADVLTTRRVPSTGGGWGRGGEVERRRKNKVGLIPKPLKAKGFEIPTRNLGIYSEDTEESQRFLNRSKVIRPRL